MRFESWTWKCYLIRELMLHEFELSHNATEAMKNIFCVKSLVTWWLKKFRSGCKNLDDQARSSWLKTVDSEAVLQVIAANPTSRTSVRLFNGKSELNSSSVIGGSASDLLTVRLGLLSHWTAWLICLSAHVVFNWDSKSIANQSRQSKNERVRPNN